MSELTSSSNRMQRVKHIFPFKKIDCNYNKLDFVYFIRKKRENENIERFYTTIKRGAMFMDISSWNSSLAAYGSRTWDIWK